MNPDEIDVMKLTPEDYLKMHDRCKELERDNILQHEHILELEMANSKLSGTIRIMHASCERAVELHKLLDEVFEIKPNEFVSDDQIRLKMKQLREQCVNLENENKLQQDHIREVEDALLTFAREAENSTEHIKNLSFCITDVRKSAEKYHDEAEAYIKLKNSYRDKCNLLLEEKAGLEKRLRDAEKENDELTKELIKRLYGEVRCRDHDADVYQQGAVRYANPDIWKLSDRLVDGAMGMCGEAGEASEIVKKYTFQNHTLDTEHLASELGDVLWYIAYTADTIGYPLSRIMEINQEKLQARYSDGQFDAQRSRHREEGDI